MDTLSFIKFADIQTSADPHLKSISKFNMELCSDYYKSYYKDKFKDHTFLIFSQNTYVGYVICYQIDNKLCFPSEGIKIFLRDEAKPDPKLYQGILQQLESITQQYGCAELIIKDELKEGKLSSLGEILLNARYQSKILFEMMIDFKDFKEEEYFKTIRKSYKSLINWGKKNLEIKNIDTANPAMDDFLSFKEFHHKIAERKTRSDESWQLQYEMIKQGFGELILAYYQGKLVAGSLFVKQNSVMTYAVGVYERSLFEFGISHYVLYHGICRASQQDSIKSFSLGVLETDITDPKLYNIQFFKKGFCQNLVPTLLWSKKINTEV